MKLSPCVLMHLNLREAGIAVQSTGQVRQGNFTAGPFWFRLFRATPASFNRSRADLLLPRAAFRRGSGSAIGHVAGLDSRSRPRNIKPKPIFCLFHALRARAETASIGGRYFAVRSQLGDDATNLAWQEWLLNYGTAARGHKVAKCRGQSIPGHEDDAPGRGRVRQDRAYGYP